MTPICPNCKAEIHTVRPVRIKTDPDSKRWVGRSPEALGLVDAQALVDAVARPAEEPAPADPAIHAAPTSTDGDRP